ncbi:MAG: hypothetical protein OXU67_08320 [Chloroflexota bacterium]|nr:hypothetical protein [Chloroflexota bacterium]
MIELLDRFYARRPSPLAHSQCEPGRICDTAAVYLDHGAHIPVLETQYDSAKMVRSYSIRHVGPQYLRQRQGIYPVYEIGQRSDEVVIVRRHKWRPAIVVSSPCDVWQAHPRQHDECFVVAPLYSFGARVEKQPYPQTFIDRVKAYAYNQLFYMPPDTRYGIQESFVRFDRLQVVHQRWLVPRNVVLDADFLDTLQSWLQAYLGGDLAALNDVLSLYRQEKLSALGITT